MISVVGKGLLEFPKSFPEYTRAMYVTDSDNFLCSYRFFINSIIYKTNKKIVEILNLESGIDFIQFGVVHRLCE